MVVGNQPSALKQILESNYPDLSYTQLLQQQPQQLQQPQPLPQQQPLQPRLLLPQLHQQQALPILTVISPRTTLCANMKDHLQLVPQKQLPDLSQRVGKT